MERSGGGLHHRAFGIPNHEAVAMQLQWRAIVCQWDVHDELALEEIEITRRTAATRTRCSEHPHRSRRRQQPFLELVADDGSDCYCPRLATVAEPRAAHDCPPMSLFDPRPTRLAQKHALLGKPFAAQRQRVGVACLKAQRGRGWGSHCDGDATMISPGRQPGMSRKVCPRIRRPRTSSFG